MFSRLLRHLRPRRAPPAPPVLRLPPPADAQLGGQYPSQEQMTRYTYEALISLMAAEERRRAAGRNTMDHKNTGSTLVAGGKRF
ncbi:hypothetical protein FAGAP_2571 [Fusarium agapanthi]|uniref:Uncharacterized protein n=1 Tax=Fusarium agapanthi TaxID=1803897 RepID=A0A9P5BFN9_9HYPO|nr:hypothetical protein FAGAP_2571 [Fusarium agapanthi]